MDRRTLIGTLTATTVGMALGSKTPLLAHDHEDVPAPRPVADYTPKPFSFDAGLPGLSKDLLAEHLALYKGYVNRSNALLKDVLASEVEGKATPAVQELRRRLGFEFSGMRLHELFFEGLSPQGAKPSESHPLQRQIALQWGSPEAWWQAFKATCTMPGIGWGALLKDPITGRLANAWIQDHENAFPVGMQPVLVLDVWEHAYVKDYGATGRAKYVDTVRPLLRWDVLEKRF